MRGRGEKEREKEGEGRKEEKKKKKQKWKKKRKKERGEKERERESEIRAGADCGVDRGWSATHALSGDTQRVARSGKKKMGHRVFGTGKSSRNLGFRDLGGSRAQ